MEEIELLGDKPVITNVNWKSVCTFESAKRDSMYVAFNEPPNIILFVERKDCSIVFMFLDAGFLGKSDFRTDHSRA